MKKENLGLQVYRLDEKRELRFTGWMEKPMFTVWMEKENQGLQFE